MDHQQTCLARSCKNLLDRLHRNAKSRNIITESLTEPAGLQEISLHVDYDQGGAAALDRQRRWICLDCF
jgi:hypothetical protein